MAISLLWQSNAFAQRATTTDGLDRCEEVLELALEDGLIRRSTTLPIIVVSSAPRYEESAKSYEAAVAAMLIRVFGSGNLRICDACMRPQTYVQSGRLERIAGPMALDEIVALDERSRGDADAAQAALWLDENRDGVALKIVDLRNGNIIMAQNFDGMLREKARSGKTLMMAEELDRRIRGESITHSITDVGLFPNAHIAIDALDQWGPYNRNLAGVTLTFINPLAGVGLAYYRVIDPLNMTIGGRVAVSLPSAMSRAITDSGDEADIIDPLLTGVFVLRIPIGKTDYAGVFTASTKGTLAIGISLLNTSFLPWVP